MNYHVYTKQPHDESLLPLLKKSLQDEELWGNRLAEFMKDLRNRPDLEAFKTTLRFWSGANGIRKKILAIETKGIRDGMYSWVDMEKLEKLEKELADNWEMERVHERATHLAANLYV